MQKLFSIDVPCGQCGAPAGTACTIIKAGAIIRAPHKIRVARAARLSQERTARVLNERR